MGRPFWSPQYSSMTMRRSILKLLFYFAGFLAICSCSGESVDVDDYNKQTQLVFMSWSGSATSSGLYGAFKANLDSIEKAIVSAKGTNGRVLVFLSSSAENSELYEILYANGSTYHQSLKSYSGSPYTTAEGITGILNDVQTFAPALNYAMIIGGHGCGWTYKDDWVQYPYQAKSGMRRSSATTTSAYPLTRFYGSVSDNTYSTDIPTLAEAIKASGLKMQYVLFDDCYMANIETAYELKDATNFLIGSTSEVMDIGMPYQTMWSSLATSTPNYQTAANNFLEFYSNYTRAPYGALSVIDCRKLDEVAARMKLINERYTFDSSQLDSLQVLDGFHTPMFFDLGDYVAHLCKNTDLLNDFNAALSSAVKATVHTDQLYSYIYLSDGPHTFTLKHYSGVTISDPSQNSVAIKGKEKTAWWKATHK